MKRSFVFTSESVTEGHPDKLCDQISDAFVDHILSRDPHARVVAECAVATSILFIAARFDTNVPIDFPSVAREVVGQVGYTDSQFNAKTCSILTSLREMAPDELSRFDERNLSDEEIERVVARNQVTVFGYACTQTPAFMPLPIWLAHKLARRLTSVRLQKILPYLAPDGWTQVGVEYQDRMPSRIQSLTLDRKHEGQGVHPRRPPARPHGGGRRAGIRRRALATGSGERASSSTLTGSSMEGGRRSIPG